MQNEAGEAAGGDKVEFDLGADKLVLEDTNTMSKNGGGTVTVGSTELANVKLDIVTSSDSATATTAGTDNGDVQISSIEVYYQPSQDLYVPVDGKLSDVADAAEYEEGNVFLDGFDIEFKGLQVPVTEEIKLSASNNDNYRLKFKNKAGQQYNEVIACFNSSTSPGLANVMLGQLSGSTYRDLHTQEGASVAEKDYLVVSKSKYSHILQYTNINPATASDNQGTVTFKDVADGSVYSVSYAALTGDLVLDGNTFKVNVTSDTANSGIFVDLDGSGSMETDLLEDNSHMIWTNKEAAINITEVVGSGVNVLVTTETQEDKSSKDSVLVRFQETGTDILDLNSTITISGDNYNWGSAVGLLTIGDGYIKNVYTKYGMMVEHDTRSSTTDNQDILTITYPDTQVSAAVYVTAGAITTTSSEGVGAGTVETTEIVRVDVGAAVLASKVVNSIEDNNLIVVGGPCANVVAASLSGNPANCAAGYETGKAKLKLFEHANGKVALLVAGASADDTTRASKVIAKYDAYDLEGEEMEVITTSDADISVSKVEMMEEAVVEEEAVEEEAAAEEEAAEE
jgi:hypothetical protein